MKFNIALQVWGTVKLHKKKRPFALGWSPRIHSKLANIITCGLFLQIGFDGKIVDHDNMPMQEELMPEMDFGDAP